MNAAKHLKTFLLLSLFLLPFCVFFQQMRNHRLVLITGCARSGTTYTAKLLQEGGLRVGHERVRRSGLCSWDLAVDPEEGRWHVRRGQYQFAHIFHQVRHPLKTISSVYSTEDGASWNYIRSQLPQILDTDSHLLKCAKYWYYWNLAAEKRAEWTYRLEDLADRFDEFQNRLKTNGRCFTWEQAIYLWDDLRVNRDALKCVSKETNTKGKHPEFTWDDLEKELDSELFFNIRALAVRYGYTLEH